MEKKSKIFENGATWLRADFHLHTKADKEFSFTGNENDFVRLYVEKLKEQGIHVGIITNHNKFDKDEFAALRKKALKEGIGLFAGVELSVNDGANGIHCLVVFDYDRWCTDGEDYIDQFLTSAFEGTANRENENTRCHYNFEGILRKLNDHLNKGRPSFVILAHVEQSSGFFHEMKGGRIQQSVANDLFKRFVLGFQKARTADKVPIWKNWTGDRLPAFVGGSDCKTMEGVGVPHTQNGEDKRTYVKIGDFNFEALTYALTDWEHRMSADRKPEVKNSYIKSISFEGGLLDGNAIGFSPALNTLIGIRGSGKSSVLEVLRHTLGIPLSHVAADPRYKDGLIENVLKSGGKTIVHIVNRRKEEYRIEKIYGQKADIYKDGALQPSVSIEAVFDRPVYFGQKDLSNKDADFESDLIQRLIGTRLKDIQGRIHQKKRDVEHVVTEMKKLRNLEDLKKETETVINNARHQLDFFKKQGVEEKLKQQTIFDSDIAKLDQVNQGVSGYLSGLDALLSDNGYFFQQEISGSDINKEFFDEARGLMQELKAEFGKLKQAHANAANISRGLKKVIEKISVKKEDLKEDFAKIKREINTETINPDNFLTLNRQVETSLLKLKEIEKSEKKGKNCKTH